MDSTFNPLNWALLFLAKKRSFNVRLLFLTLTILFPASNWFGKTWRPLREKKRDTCCGVLFKLLLFCVCCSLYSSAWLSAIYHNAYVTTRDEEKVRAKTTCHFSTTLVHCVSLKLITGDLTNQLGNVGRLSWIQISKFAAFTFCFIKMHSCTQFVCRILLL